MPGTMIGRLNARATACCTKAGRKAPPATLLVHGFPSPSHKQLTRKRVPG